MSELPLVHTVRPAAPGANAPGVRPPLLVLLHGVGSNERSMAQLAPALDRRFVVLSVRSPLLPEVLPHAAARRRLVSGQAARSRRTIRTRTAA